MLAIACPEDDNSGFGEQEFDGAHITKHRNNHNDLDYEDDKILVEGEPSCKRAHIEDSHDFNKSFSSQHTRSPPVTSHTHKGKNIP